MKLVPFFTALAVLLTSCQAQLLSFLQYPNTASPQCVPFIIDQVDSGRDICVSSVSGLLKTITFQFPYLAEYTYSFVSTDYGCTKPLFSDPLTYLYQSPIGCTISADKQSASCTLDLALTSFCNGCKSLAWVTNYAKLTRKSDNAVVEGSGKGSCLTTGIGGSCTTWRMAEQLTLICGGNTVVSSRVYIPPTSSSALPASSSLSTVTTSSKPPTTSSSSSRPSTASTAAPLSSSAPPSSASASVSSSTAASTVVSSPVPQGGQCGGTGWTGSTTCVTDYTCTVVNSTLSVCAYSGTGLQIEGGQCGGTDWYGMTKCQPDDTCFAWSSSYSVCRSTLVAAGLGSQCGGATPAGGIWWGPSTCPSGMECYAVNSTYSGCRSTAIQKTGLQCAGTDPATNGYWWGPYKCASGEVCTMVSSTMWTCQAPVSTGTPTVSAVVATQTPGGQCGGLGYTGPIQCPAGFVCWKFTPSWAECRPSTETGLQCGGTYWFGSTTCPAGQTCFTYTPSYSACISSTDANQVQCGGSGWTGSTTCPSGYVCYAFTSLYSQCIPSAMAMSLSAGGSLATTTVTAGGVIPSAPYVMICTA